MTEPHAQADPTQPYQPRPGEGVEWPTAPLPTAQPTTCGQPERPTGYGQSAPPPQAYGQPYAQPMQPYGQQQYAQPMQPYGQQQYAQPMQAYGGQTSSYAQPQGQQAPYGQAYAPNIVINNVVQSTAVAGVGGRTKSAGVAFLLTFLFGPLGMFYSTVAGAIVMLVASLVLVPLTGGIAAFVVWPISIIWGCVAASRANAGVRVSQTSLR
ncbi:MAG TPA: hypothetical protein VIJ07_09390 [Dermatophilaceae bacterium]